MLKKGRARIVLSFFNNRSLYFNTLFVCLQKVTSRSFCTIFLPASRFLFLSLSLFFLSSQIQEELEAPNPHFMFYLCSTLLSLA